MKEQKKLELKIKTLQDNLMQGTKEASKLVLKTSSRLTKKVKGAPIELLAINLDKTLQTFITDRSSELLRYGPLAERIVQLLLTEKSKNISFIDNPKKSRQVATALGFMAGVAVMQSVIPIFTKQAIDRLQKKEDLSENARTLCLAFVHDALALVMVALVSSLETNDYKVDVKERQLFLSVLQNNNWVDPKVENEAEDQVLP